ncbi:MAG: hypothetical protein EA375_02135 [Acholeplasmataceae bacterium]|nr:MAG: hypothetical protein EA375_02135 [Acholeplasmataceae bacterium]
MRKTFSVCLMLSLLLAACSQTRKEDDAVTAYDIQTVSGTHATGKHVFESLSDLSAFKADHGLDELDIDGYDDAFFEDASLIIIVFDEEETVVYVESIHYVGGGLEVRMIRTTQPLTDKTSFLIIGFGKKHLLTPDQISHEIRDAIRTNGLVAFEFTRYNSQTDFSDVMNFEDNLHIINSTASFAGFSMAYPHMIPSDTSSFGSVFFENHTLLIVQLRFGAYYYNSVVVHDVLIEDHHATATIRITVPTGAMDPTIYSFWIVIDKNENITSTSYQLRNWLWDSSASGIA